MGFRIQHDFHYTQDGNVDLIINKVGIELQKVESKEYVVLLTDYSGKLWHLQDCDLDEITSNI